MAIKEGESLRENGMFRRDNNGQTTLNRTILDCTVRYRIALCDDSDLRFYYHLQQRFSLKILTKIKNIFKKIICKTDVFMDKPNQFRLFYIVSKFLYNPQTYIYYVYYRRKNLQFSTKIKLIRELTEVVSVMLISEKFANNMPYDI